MDKKKLAKVLLEAAKALLLKETGAHEEDANRISTANTAKEKIASAAKAQAAKADDKREKLSKTLAK